MFRFGLQKFKKKSTTPGRKKSGKSKAKKTDSDDASKVPSVRLNYARIEFLTKFSFLFSVHRIRGAQQKTDCSNCRARISHQKAELGKASKCKGNFGIEI